MVQPDYEEDIEPLEIVDFFYNSTWLWYHVEIPTVDQQIM